MFAQVRDKNVRDTLQMLVISVEKNTLGQLPLVLFQQCQMKN